MPCDYSQYPLDWHARIRPEILARASHRCERCGIANYTVVRRPCEVRLRVFSSYASARSWRDSVLPILRNRGYAFRLSVVVLTVAHLDHELLHNDPSNLQALCQQCHNSHDAEHRSKKRHSTIQAKADLIAPRLPLFPLKRADVMPSMRGHHRIAPLIYPAS